MTTLLTESTGIILDNFADAIEGGNTHRGSGTAYKGVPGTRTWHDWVKANGTGLAVDAGVSSTTAIKITGVPAAQAATMVRVSGPPFFLLATTAATAGVTGAARKIASHTGVTFTTAAFPGVVLAADVMSIVEGFKRVPDGLDIEADGSEESPAGYDRFFRLSMLPGERVSWAGNGVSMYRAVLAVDLRILRRSRQHQCAESALENAGRIAYALTMGAHRGTYVQVCEQATAPTPIKDDINKVVVRSTFNVLYQLNTSLL